MKNLVLFGLLLFSPFAFAESEGDQRSVAKCLKNWGKHPFGKPPYKFKIIRPGVKVLGIGSAQVDNEKTKKPRLILVKPGVSVLTGNKYQFLNPNGWYCLKANVTVLAKSQIEAHCKAKIVGTKDDEVTVAGSNQTGQGVTVLGKTQITRVNCPKKSK